MSDNPLTTGRLQEWALGLAEHVALLSKDPSTKVGAAIFDDKRRLVSVGYNGFARGVDDSSLRLLDRETKLKLTLHAEKNAILFATAPLEGCTLVVTHPCCAQCAAQVVQSGIRHVVWRTPSPEFSQRWCVDMDLTKSQFLEAGVTITEVCSDSNKNH
jgi:dCMP deaminase